MDNSALYCLGVWLQDGMFVKIDFILNQTNKISSKLNEELPTVKWIFSLFEPNDVFSEQNNQITPKFLLVAVNNSIRPSYAYYGRLASLRLSGPGSECIYNGNIQPLGVKGMSRLCHWYYTN